MSRHLPGLDQYDRSALDDYHADPTGSRQTKSLQGGSKTPNLPTLGAQNPMCHKCRRYVEDCPYASAALAARQAALDGILERLGGDLTKMTAPLWAEVQVAEDACGPHPSVDPRPRVRPAGHVHFWGQAEFGLLEREVGLEAQGSWTGQACVMCSAKRFLPDPPR